MINKNTLRACTLSLVLGLTACVSAPPETSAMPDLTFGHLKQIPLNVAKVEIYNEYKPAEGQGGIEYEFSTPPVTAATRLIEKTLKANGDHRVLRVFIDDASVKSEKLKVPEGFFSKFDRDPAERLDGRVSLRFELVNEDAPDIIIGHANVISDRTKTLLENTSLNERDRAYLNLTEAMMADLYAGFNSTVYNTFGYN